ncbi:VraH family peptide resistance protein [Staphylococcus pasteuri]|uniref:VraH family peptide resistance protein n=1 Tax=Staphylococcus pasteuri TaxID=45972 RepID=UPI00118091D5|nr:VraH family protein [Staphylococcus pasteuri]MEB6612048.1 VraH family protein [Staphylococcus pasteuri]QQN53585.1 VraH family protein [Staphylococcus pasteuri]
MRISEIWNYLINKKWDIEDIMFLALFIFLGSIFTTPILGVPIGVIAYLFLIDDDFN